MLTLTAKDMPEILKQLARPPKQLHIIGQSLEKFISLPRIAIVGSRKFSPYGKAVTQKFASQLASRGVVIISGLALGTDSIAHKAAIDTGGKTIAVLPCGPDRVYPSSHTQLARDIVLKGGALVTEYDAGIKIFPNIFLERNRLIAALSEGVLITEAAARSGTLNTVAHALELGKPVFAVPGNISSPLSEGCNNLIKMGAMPVTSIDDIIRALAWQTSTTQNTNLAGSNEEENTILRLLKQGITDGSELLKISGLNPVIFNQSLTMLELTGQVHSLGANQWTI
jgi:DNA processing protein